MAITLTDIKTEFGAYYMPQGQGEKDLVQKLYQKSETEELFSTRIITGTRYQGAESLIDRLIQPFQKEFTPIGNVDFKPIIIEMDHMKVDFKEYLSDLEESWLGFLADNGEKTVDNYPFVRWLMENHILPQVTEDDELNEVFLGIKAAPTPGTAGAAGTARNGVRKIINDFINAGRISPISTGTLETSPEDFVTQIEDFHAQVTERYRGVSMQLAMNKTLALRYDRGYLAKYGRNMNFKDNPRREVAFTNIEVVGVASMASSSKIWMTPKQNAIRLINGVNPKWEIGQFSERQVSIFADWYKALGFLIPEIVFTNDQDLDD